MGPLRCLEQYAKRALRDTNVTVGEFYVYIKWAFPLPFHTHVAPKVFSRDNCGFILLLVLIFSYLHGSRFTVHLNLSRLMMF